MSTYLRSLEKTFICWKGLGLWPDGVKHRYYTLYSFVYIFLTLVLYNATLMLNIYYVPGKIELLIQEITFLFNIVAITIKVIMILVWKNTIKEVLVELNSEEFNANDEAARTILCEDLSKYNLYWKFIVGLGNFAFLFKSFIPVIAYLTMSSYNIQLPTSNYYFLNDDLRNKYFVPIFLYQCFGIYGLMMYDITTDTFHNGCIYFGITQIKILSHSLRNLKNGIDKELAEDVQEKIYIWKLKKCLRHYDSISRYVNNVQDIINVTMFVKYAMGSLVICVLLCGLLLPMTMEAFTFMLSYLMGMILQIYVPGWLGTQITEQSQELVFAAYNSEWVSRTEPFKKSIKVFMERANTPIVLVGLQLFPLSLQTFASIMKKAYSFVTIVKNFQDSQEAAI